ncbi:PTS cellobiose transporter subunit IIC [Latilactobacillus curvatus]|uniref:Permease IIC component n=1 Tax=Latilactobacillus curvatus TaxID=28038 RepID=A0AAC9USZ4_LATCU|nr:PTS cellobiose transporter subunit IIC [Latilactobacillus curvatus]ASN60817.1 PTS cellobiose transporter subunit IIC [Latilactobacillus curvatus]
METEDRKLFQFMNKHLMGPMGKLASFPIVQAVMAAGMASIPFTIVGSMFLIINILPQSFPFLTGIWAGSFDKVTNLYMLANGATMGILSLYFCLVFGYEYTKIQASAHKIDVNPLNGALLSMMAFFMCIPQLVFKGGVATLVTTVNKTTKIVDGYEIAGGVTRLGTTGIFTAIIMAIIAVKIYAFLVQKKVTIKMPETVPVGVSRSFTALIPTATVALVVILINGLLIAINTDIYKIVAIPFGFVTSLTNTWVGLLVVYFLMHALWLVGIHGATIVTSFLTPIVLSNMQDNIHGAHIPFAAEFNNMFVTIGGSGSTLGMVIFIAFFARSAQLSALGKASLVPAIFNINEPILFGMPIVYNPFTAIPFFLAPMASMSLAYFAIKLQFVNPPVAQQAWPTPVGLGAFIGTAGDWRAIILAVLCALVAFIIWLPFIKAYDSRLFIKEQAKTDA